eukprot:gnl/Chilomastix_cuspidata/3330.p3 GENE.gnl/Chilomastix_cuspidata/3330~~gnl/Chilomastix_cuspidata/3330.p3  ORF type:complete len:202 (-),score=79.78 gnl/Chilomastix_cuspidata/3330:93-698(-)
MATLDFGETQIQGSVWGELKNLGHACSDLCCCRGEISQLFADKMLRSTAYIILLFVMMILILGLFIWGLVDSSAMDETLFIVLDSLVTLELMAELIVKLVAQRPRRFIRNVFNIIDLVVFCLSFTSFLITVTVINNRAEEIDEYVSLTILIVRDIITFVRIVRFIKESAARVRGNAKFNNAEFADDLPEVTDSDRAPGGII